MSEVLEYCDFLSPDAAVAASVLRVMEKASRMHTLQLGIDRAHMLKRYGAVWMIARCYLHFNAQPAMSLPLAVRTWHRGFIHGVMYRDFDLLQGGKQIGQAVQTWVLVDNARRRLLRMDKIPELLHTPHPEHTKALHPRKLKMPDLLQQAAPICAGKDAIDENGHINNAAYVDLVLQTLPAPIETVKTLELCYHRECFAGQSLARQIWQENHQSYVCLHTPDGSVAFELLATDSDCRKTIKWTSAIE